MSGPDEPPAGVEPSDGRDRSRAEHEALLDEVAEKVTSHPDGDVLRVLIVIADRLGSALTILTAIHDVIEERIPGDM